MEMPQYHANPASKRYQWQTAPTAAENLRSIVGSVRPGGLEGHLDTDTNNGLCQLLLGGGDSNQVTQGLRVGLS